MRFKIEYLKSDGDVSGWIFPRDLMDLNVAIVWVTAGALPAGATNICIRDADARGAVVWRSSDETKFAA